MILRRLWTVGPESVCLRPAVRRTGGECLAGSMECCRWCRTGRIRQTHRIVACGQPHDGGEGDGHRSPDAAALVVIVQFPAAGALWTVRPPPAASTFRGDGRPRPMTMAVRLSPERRAQVLQQVA